MKRISLIAKQVGFVLYRILILLIIFYAGFVIYRQINKNYLTNQEINRYEAEIASLKIQNKNLSNLLVYYQSKSFKELEMRKRLGYKKDGETVLISPENKDLTDEEIQQIKNDQPEKDEIPNYQKWLKLIFPNIVF